MKTTANYIILTIIFLALLASCSMERKIAKGFLTIKDSLSVLLIQPGYIYKTNAKTWEIENFEDLSGWVQDSILYDKSLFIKEVDDSIFFEKYFSGLQNGLINLGITVFNQDRIVDFMNVKGTAFQVAVVQLELEEDIYPYRAEEIFDDTVAYYEDFNLNTVNVNNWYEITKLNDPLAINNLLYASHYVMDELEGRFANNIFTGEVKFKYNLTPMDVNKIYNLAQMLGEKYAGYVFDYMLNEHVYRNIGNHVRPGTYFHYDPQIKTLYPAGADRFIFLDN